MNNGYQEIWENIFQSGWLSSVEDWKIVDQIARERKRPAVIINLMNEGQDIPQIFWPPAWSLVWFNIPDEALDFSEIKTTPEDLFKLMGKTIKAFHDANYLVWVHCAAGHSRATAANIVFRMLNTTETKDEAFEKIKNIRTTITDGPNEFFMEVLSNVYIAIKAEKNGLIAKQPKRLPKTIKIEGK